MTSEQILSKPARWASSARQGQHQGKEHPVDDSAVNKLRLQVVQLEDVVSRLQETQSVFNSTGTGASSLAYLMLSDAICKTRFRSIHVQACLTANLDYDLNSHVPISVLKCNADRLVEGQSMVSTIRQRHTCAVLVERAEWIGTNLNLHSGSSDFWLLLVQRCTALRMQCDNKYHRMRSYDPDCNLLSSSCSVCCDSWIVASSPSCISQEA